MNFVIKNASPFSGFFTFQSDSPAVQIAWCPLLLPLVARCPSATQPLQLSVVDFQVHSIVLDCWLWASANLAAATTIEGSVTVRSMGNIFSTASRQKARYYAQK